MQPMALQEKSRPYTFCGEFCVKYIPNSTPAAIWIYKKEKTGKDE